MPIDTYLRTLRDAPGGATLLKELRTLASEGVSVFLDSGRDKVVTARVMNESDLPARLKDAARRAAAIVPELEEWSKQGALMWTILVQGLLLLGLSDETSS